LGEQDRLFWRIMRGGSDSQIPFEKLCDLLEHLEFSTEVQGSRNTFYRHDIEDMLDLQSSWGGMAKAYQIEQVRNLLRRYKITP
jgi:hypothetical protein